jgi:hypothetical protein
MGTYHTFFVAKDDDLDRLFPGWKPVKPEQVQRERVNPFTKKPITVLEWVPVEPPMPLGRPCLYDDVWGPATAPIGEVANGYMAHVEGGGAPGLRALPHFRGKNVDRLLELEPLARALVGSEIPVPPARVGADKDDDVTVVWALPKPAAERLASLDDAALNDVFNDVVVAAGDETREDERAFYVEHVLCPLRALAVEAGRRDARVCHYFALHY